MEMSNYMSKYLVLILLLVSACAPDAPKYTEPKATSVIIYRPAYWTNMRSGSSVTIEVNGVKACDLHTGSYFLIPPGHNTITASLALYPGTSRITTDKRFIRMDEDANKKAMIMAAGLIGALIAEGASDHGGQFVFTEMDGDAARKELVNLVQDCQ